MLIKHGRGFLRTPNDGDGDGGDGGGGEGGRTFTQEDLNRINAKANKRIAELQTQLDAAPKQSSIDDLQTQLDAMATEKALAGKTETERLQHEHTRALEKLANKQTALETELKERGDAVLAAQGTLKKERMARAFGSALTKAKVFPSGASDALAVLMGQLTDAEVADNGDVTASYGSDLIDEAPDAIAARFLADRPYFATASAGGSGTPKPNGAGGSGRSGSTADMTADECFEEAGPAPTQT